MTVSERLAEIRKRVEAATKGPWRTAYAYKKESWGLLVAATAPGHQVHSVGNKSGTYPSADLDFIAAARTLLPLALDVVEKAAALVEEWDGEDPLPALDKINDVRAALHALTQQEPQ